MSDLEDFDSETVNFCFPTVATQITHAEFKLCMLPVTSQRSCSL